MQRRKMATPTEFEVTARARVREVTCRFRVGSLSPEKVITACNFRTMW